MIDYALSEKDIDEFLASVLEENFIEETLDEKALALVIEALVCNT